MTTRLTFPSVIFVLASIAPIQAQTMLRYQFKEGETIEYVSDQKIVMTMDIGGNKIKNTVAHEIHTVWHVVNVDKKDGTARIQVKVTRYKMTMDGLFATKFDSAIEGNQGDKGGIARALAGVSVEITILANGEIKATKYSEDNTKLYDKIYGDKFGLSYLKKDAVKLVASFIELPKDAIEKGKTWTKESEEANRNETTKTKTTYTLEGPAIAGETIEKISSKTDISVVPNPGVKTMTKVTGAKASGVITFDTKAGRIIESSSDQRIDSISDAFGSTHPSVVETTTAMRLKK